MADNDGEINKEQTNKDASPASAWKTKPDARVAIHTERSRQ